MNEIEEIEEEKLVTVAQENLVLDKNISLDTLTILSILEKEKGYDFGDKKDYSLDIEKFDEIDNGDTFIYRITINKIEKIKVPYKIEKEEVFSGLVDVDLAKTDDRKEQQKIFVAMRRAGVEIDADAEYHIKYKEEELNTKGEKHVIVFKYNRVRLDEEENLNNSSIKGENIEIIKEDIFVGSFISSLVNIRDENAIRDKIIQMMTDADISVESEEDFEIIFEKTDDENIVKFRIRCDKEEKVPYTITNQKVFSCQSEASILNLDEDEQRERIFDNMRAKGIAILDKDEFEINYKQDNDLLNIDVFRKQQISNRQNQEADNIRETEIAEMSELLNGTITISEGDTKDQLNNRVYEILNVSGINISEEGGELLIRYDSDNIKDGQLPFTVSQLKKVKLKYQFDRELVGKGVAHNNEDIYAAIQRNQGLDIRNSLDYEIVSDINNYKEYTLYKIKKNVLEKETINNNTLNNESLVEESMQNDDSLEELVYLKSKLDKIGAELELEKYDYNYINSELEEIEKLDRNPSKIKMDTFIRLKALEINLENVMKTLDEFEREYVDSFEKSKEISQRRTNDIESAGILSEEEALRFIEDRYKEEIEEEEKAQTIMKKIISQKNIFNSLNDRKKALEASLYSNLYGMPEDDYDKISGVLEKIIENPEMQDKILSKHGITNREILENGITKNLFESGIVADVYNRQQEDGLDIVDAIEALYDVDARVILEGEPRSIDMSQQEFDNVRTGVLDLPEKVMNNSAPRDYTPLEAPEDMKDVHESKRDIDLGYEKIVIYRDLDNNKVYANKHVFDRFYAKKNSPEVKIDNKTCFELSEGDLEFIMGNANNEYSPYNVKFKDINFINENEALTSKNQETAVFENENKVNDIVDKIVIYIDEKTGEKYANKYVFDRFYAKKVGEEVVIEGKTCYKLNDDDLDFIVNNANNDYSPYVIEYRHIELTKEDEDSHENEEEEKPEEIEEINITLYKDLNDNNQIYGDAEVLRVFGITPEGEGKEINNSTCYKISQDANQLINHFARESVNPKYIINYENVKLRKKVKPHVESILDKLTNDLDIKAKDYKRFTASNIRVADEFKKELRSGNFLYNIVHIVPAIAKATFKFFRKLTAKLITSKRAKKVMKELDRRLDEDLNDEELEVLFDEYKGSQLKTDMNNQINGSILKRLKRFGLEKVENLNESIKNEYSSLFTLLGEIKAIEDKVKDKTLDKNDKNALLAERRSLIARAAKNVKTILINRKDANNLLSGGVHGLEEDFKAVATKLSYVGMRFGKNNNFDNELQHKLGEYGEGLSEALSTGDDALLLKSFMGMESCYYENTEVARSIVGKRSIGSKYYSPLAEQFDYRDDPFIRDLFTTVAITSSAVSAVNSYRVHQIEAQELLRKQQSDAKNINSANDSILEYVHQTGKDIESKRGEFQAGMEAQSHQDVLNSANMIERAELDMNNWSFSNAYHEVDKMGHSFFNEFNENVTKQINDISSRYGSGAINQVQALQEMAEVSKNAQGTLANVTGECIDILKDYAQNHPQFDLRAMQESMDYIVENPNAISEMNQAMVDATNLAGALQGLSANHVEVLSSLPSDMLSTIVCAASASGLALNVSKTMNEKYNKNKGYGNEVVDMMEEYINSLMEQEENMETKDEDVRKKVA